MDIGKGNKKIDQNLKHKKRLEVISSLSFVRMEGVEPTHLAILDYKIN